LGQQLRSRRDALAKGRQTTPELCPAGAPRLTEAPVKSLLGDERFRVVAETIVDGLIVIGADGAIRYFNSGCEKLFGYAADEVIGQNVKILMPSPLAEAHDSYLARHRATKVRRIIGIGREITGMRRNGETFPMHLSVGEGVVDEGVVYVGVIYDLTEKRRNAELLLHHQKLDALGHLSGGVAHDFNNIINIITGNLEILEDQNLPPSARRAVQRAQDAAWRAARITQRLLAFARRQPLTPQVLDLNKSLSGMTEMLHRSLGEHIKLQLELDESIPKVEVDIDQFETAILNLALNARDAMTGGGTLCIETEKVHVAPDDGPAAFDPRAPTYVLVSISDNGQGMPKEVRQRAFEPFFTTKDPGSGTGLGLSMVYGFLNQIGGHVSLYSEPGQGTRVSLYFPPADVGPDAASASHPETTASKGERVLVVEDDADVRFVTVARLESLGYHVIVAVDGESALELIKGGEDIDVLFSDVIMPGDLNGHQLAQAALRERPNLAIVLTSGYSRIMAEAGARESKFMFLSKPYSKPRLAAVMREALGAR
jgi:PAS domain S-box-containing protein